MSESSKIKGKEPRQPAVRTIANHLDRARSSDEVLKYLGVLLEKCTISGQYSWVPLGKTVKVDRYTLPGMVYVGDGLMSVKSYTQVEPCLIRPRLKVQHLHRDDAKMRHPLSYTQMTPESRAAYLVWLSEGRRNSSAPIGYVWLFFYGLERRVFHDLLPTLNANEAAFRELDHIIAEVEQLSRLYGDSYHSASGMFGQQAELFLEFCRLLRAQPLCKTPDLAQVTPLLVRIALGQMVQQGQPIPADWAIAGWLQLSKKQLRLPATRCFEEFQTLFRVRYAEQFGEGLKLEPNQATFTVEYSPASPSFDRCLYLDRLPDITQSDKLSQVGDLVDACTIAVEPLSRFLGRHPEAANTSAAIALLPSALLLTHGGDVVNRLRQGLDQLFAQAESQIVVVSGRELFQYWSGKNPEKLTQTEAIGLARVLEQLGYGMEPDPGLGGTLPTFKSQTALFRLIENAPRSSTNSQATVLIQLAIMVTNRALSLKQRHCLEQRLAAIVPEESERLRLQAHLHWLLKENPKLRLNPPIEQVNPDQRRKIALCLVQVAAAEGQLVVEDVQRLEKAYALLGLDPKTVYGDIHKLATAIEKSPIVSESGNALTLDLSLIQSKLRESQEISKLLTEIFVEEAELTSPPTMQSAQPVAGLGSSHAEFLFVLTQQKVWQRNELAEIAARLDLMLDGALEEINEVAFDRCNEAVIEGDDRLEVNIDVLRELLA